MENIEISSLPKIKFALSYCSDTYANFLPKEPDFIEITYVAEGSIKIEQEGITEIAQQGDVICNLFSADRRFVSDVFQEHHTVGAFVSWNENSEAYDVWAEEHEDLEDLIDEVLDRMEDLI